MSAEGGVAAAGEHGAVKGARWFVYMVRCADGSLYTGITTDVPARVATHNAGRGAKYPRGRLPVVLVYQEAQPGHGDALRRERRIKALSVAAKRALIASGLAVDAGP